MRVTHFLSSAGTFGSVWTTITMERKYISDEKKSSTNSEVSNKWRNDWLASQDSLGSPFSNWLRKIDEAGTAYCVACNRKLVYRSNGKKSFQSHAADPDYVAAVKAQQHTSTLPTAEPVIADACISDRVTGAKLQICAFLAEHCLPKATYRPRHTKHFHQVPYVSFIMWTRLQGQYLPASC
jgi:hypothetical protein